ncbi:MAG: hypothetical protein ACRDDI_13380 [Aeromonas veronii]
MKSYYKDLRHLAGMVAGASAIAKQLAEGGVDADSLLDLLEAVEGKAEDMLCDMGENIAKSETPAEE